MERVDISVRRNIVLGGHGSAGKTSLIDRLLAVTGAVTGDHDVARGTSVCDHDPEEQAHGHTIESALTHCRHDQHELVLIDTPGYADFVASTIAAIHSVETAAICVNAHSGIQIGTRRVMEEAASAGIARCLIVTKLDDANADFAALVQQMRDLWGPSVLPLTVPLGRSATLRGVASVLQLPEEARDAAMNLAAAHEHLVERLVESDETLMEQYFSGIAPDPTLLCPLLRQAVASGHIIPVLATSTAAGVGLSELLDALALFAPSPADSPLRVISPDAEERSIHADPDGPLVARVFKTRIDPFVQKISYLRVYRGTLRRDDTVSLGTRGKSIKLGQLMRVQGSVLEPVEMVGPGEVVAVIKLDDLHIGTVLGDDDLRPIPFPHAMVGLAVAPTRRGDENKLSASLAKLAEEDPTLEVSRDEQTGELVMTGMSELHLQILRERLARRDRLEIDTHDPKIPYRETVTGTAEGSYRHKKQSGGRGQFGEVHARLLPLPRGTDIERFATKARFPQLKSYHYHAGQNFLFVDSVVGGSIPGNFMPAVEKGVLDEIASGVLAGHPIQDLAIEVHYGKHHPVDSSEQAFRTAAAHCFRDLFRHARPALLEPIVKMHVTVADDHVGDVFSDMSSRGGRVLGSGSAGGAMQVIECEVPLRAIGHYNRTLSSMTAGTGSYQIELSHYEAVPGDVQHSLIHSDATAQKESLA